MPARFAPIATHHDDQGPREKAAVKGKKQMLKLSFDCQQPVEVNIMTFADLAILLLERIKVSGKTGKLCDQVILTLEKSKINVVAEAPFSKRYLKSSRRST